MQNEARASEQQVLRVAVNAPGSYPYLYFAQDKQTYVGFVRDVLELFAQRHPYRIEYLHSNQLRSEQSVLEGKADLYLANPNWLRNPELSIATEPLIEHRTYLYSTQPFSADFDLQQHADARICAHKNYVYTGLTAYFSQYPNARVDSSDHQVMAKMLFNQRCDYAVLNEYNAAELFNQPAFCHAMIYQSPQTTSVVNLHLIMRPALTALNAELNRSIQAFKASGQLAQLTARYTDTLRFPLSARCN